MVLHTLESLKGKNLGFPLLPYFIKYAPFFSAVMAWRIKIRKWNE